MAILDKADGTSEEIRTCITGARFFEDLREQVGDEIFFTFLKNYYDQSVGKQVTSADFFRVFRETSAADITALLIEYFKNTY